MYQIDWETVDKSEWGKRPDPEIAALYDVPGMVITYWRAKFGIPSYDDYFLAERERQYANGRNWCGRCKGFRSIEDFGKFHKGRYGLRSECNPCRKKDRDENREKLKQQKRVQYERHGEKIRANNRERYRKNPIPRKVYEKARNARFKRPFVELAGRSCQRCGYSEFLSGLEFHHVDHTSKDATPVRLINSGNYEQAYAELEKCALLCRNCHQSFHASEWMAEFIKRDGLGWTIKK